MPDLPLLLMHVDHRNGPLLDVVVVRVILTRAWVFSHLFRLDFASQGHLLFEIRSEDVFDRVGWGGRVHLAPLAQKVVATKLLAVAHVASSRRARSSPFLRDIVLARSWILIQWLPI